MAGKPGRSGGGNRSLSRPNKAEPVNGLCLEPWPWEVDQRRPGPKRKWTRAQIVEVLTDRLTSWGMARHESDAELIGQLGDAMLIRTMCRRALSAGKSKLEDGSNALSGLRQANIDIRALYRGLGSFRDRKPPAQDEAYDPAYDFSNGSDRRRAEHSER